MHQLREFRPLNIKPREGPERFIGTPIYFKENKFALLGALALVSAMAATPVTTQGVI
jgi:hypothetical protein